MRRTQCEVTRDIDPKEAEDLLERVPRACIAFARPDGPQVQPVKLARRESRYLIGGPLDAASVPDEGGEVVLLVDEGVYLFDVRGIHIRGYIKLTKTLQGLPEGFTWIELEPSKTTAWDYGRMREVNDASQ